MTDTKNRMSHRERRTLLPNLLSEGLDLLLQIFQIGQNPTYKNSRILSDSADQPFFYGGKILLEIPLDHVRQDNRIQGPLHQIFQYFLSQFHQNLWLFQQQLEPLSLQDCAQTVGLQGTLLNQELLVNYPSFHRHITQIQRLEQVQLELVMKRLFGKDTRVGSTTAFPKIWDLLKATMRDSRSLQRQTQNRLRFHISERLRLERTTDLSMPTAW